MAETTTDATGSAPAKIADAKDFTPAGAPIQDVLDVDPSHPAVDANPRAGTTVDQNRIDFNDPTKPGHQVVAEALGMKVEPDADTPSDEKKSKA